MPILNLQLTAGHSAASTTALLKQATQAVVDSLDTPLASVRITLEEISPDRVIVAGEMGKSMALFTAHLIAGRTEERKAALITALNRAAQECIGISDQDVRVIIHDIPNTDMGVAGGVSAKAAGR